MTKRIDWHEAGDDIVAAAQRRAQERREKAKEQHQEKPLAEPDRYATGWGSSEGGGGDDE